jgi:pyruvate/2-oxoglutarate dehydrogenase complex dihydrolipoamide acyltransferase (E2) component
MYLLRMPKADENMAEGTVLRWLVSPGDAVKAGDDVVECLADKGSFVVYSEEAGTVRGTYAPEKSLVPVGYVLAAVGGPEEPVPDVEAGNAAVLARAGRPLRPVAHAASAAAAVGPSDARVRATPAARRLAKERGVSLVEVAEAVGWRLVREDDVSGFEGGAR